MVNLSSVRSAPRFRLAIDRTGLRFRSDPARSTVVAAAACVRARAPGGARTRPGGGARHADTDSGSPSVLLLSRLVSVGESLHDIQPATVLGRIGRRTTGGAFHGDTVVGDLDVQHVIAEREEYGEISSAVPSGVAGQFTHDEDARVESVADDPPLAQHC